MHRVLSPPRPTPSKPWEETSYKLARQIRFAWLVCLGCPPAPCWVMQGPFAIADRNNSAWDRRVGDIARLTQVRAGCFPLREKPHRGK